jgi:LPS export ABC transporter permease LptG/LPS export ABC transporter permease LptF
VNLRLARITLLDRYVVREILPPTGVGLLLFTFILLLDQISQLMRILVAKGADFGTVVRAFVYLLPSIFSVTVPMAFLLGVLLAFGRMASDSEIVALRASGVSPERLLRPVLLLSAVACAITFYVVAVALPAANQAYRELVFSLVVSKARTGMAPRVFNDDLIPGIVIYVSDMPAAQNGQWKDVFMYDDRDKRRPSVILARQGRLDVDKDNKTVEINLQKGVVHNFDALDPTGYDWLTFESRNFPLPFEQFFPILPLAKGDREMSLGELQAMTRKLRAERRYQEIGRFQVEYHKKFAIAAACIVFGLLGLGLSLGSKKEARSAAFGLSLAVIFIYYVLIRLGEQAGDTGMMAPWVAMWSANIVLGIVALVLLVLNHREAAFDPLDPSHYRALVPHIRRQAGSRPTAVRRPGPPRRVIVLRIPRLKLPIPGILDRYIARAYLGKFVLVVIAFWSLFVLVHFMDLFDDIQVNKVKGKVVFHYFAFYSPQIMHLMTPVAVLVCVLVTFGVLARRNELTAMKAAGISVYRATLPAMALALLAAGAMFAASEYVLPPTNRVKERDFNVIKGRPPTSASLLERRWVLGSDNRLYHYDYMQNRPTLTLYGLSVFDIEPARWDLRDRLYAARAAWNGVSYDLERGWRRTFGEAARFKQFEQTRSREVEPPSYFEQEKQEADTLRFAELRQHINTLETLGLDVVALQVKLHGKIAFPFVCVVMTLLGIPFAFVVARRGALYGIGLSIFMAIVYWATLHIFDALGSHAVLPPLLAAWAPNLAFGAAGLYLMLNLDT